MINKVGILYHPMVEKTQVKARELSDFLAARGVSVWSSSAWETGSAREKLEGTGLVLTVGGDGTILRAAQVVMDSATPITGVNLGKLGFMTELSADEALAKLPSLLDGEGWIDERATLEAELQSSGQEPRIFRALNEVVVARGLIPRVVYVEVMVDGERVVSYKADGVILATATGSTGYALAAGGPVIYPQSKDMLLMPVMPYLCASYPVVLPGSSLVQMRLSTVHSATLSIDGHINMPMNSSDIVNIKLGRNALRFARIHPKSYFYSSLEGRLKGK